jgi:hypothetical protein
MAFSIARNGMSGEPRRAAIIPNSHRGRADLTALHTDLSASLERMTFSPQPNLPDNRADMLLSRKSVPQHRRKQIRVLVSVSGIPRLPPHKVSKSNYSVPSLPLSNSRDVWLIQR